jgi:uncharacterized protein
LIKPFGKTGLNLFSIGFGGIPIQRLERQEAIDLVQTAYKEGIQFYDTARAYTTSESIIGQSLEKVRKNVFLASKSDLRSYKGISQHLEESLHDLRSEFIDLYQLHMVNKRQEWVEIKAKKGALKALREAQSSGVIRYIGITSHNPGLLIDILNEAWFDSIMIPYNYLATLPRSQLLPLAKSLDVATIAMKPIGGGALTNAALSLKFLLMDEMIDIVIPGVERKEEIYENVKTAKGKLSITTTDKETIEKDRLELGNEYCRGCDYCQPCPNNVPISFILRAHSQFVRRTGWTDFVIDFTKSLGDVDKMCINCGKCEARCPYNLPIRRLIRSKSMELATKLGEYEQKIKD